MRSISDRSASFRFFILMIVCMGLSYPVAAQDFFEASWRGDKGVIEKALEENPDLVNTLSDWGYSALMMAVIWGRGGQADIVDLLIAKGADINLQNATGKTVLHLAAVESDSKMIKFLIDRGADGEVKDHHGLLPFFYAVTAENREVVDLLYKAGMDVNTTGENASHLLHASAKMGYTPLIAILLKEGIDLDVVRKDGGNLLHSAAEGDLPKLIRKAIQQGVDPDARNIYRYSPLHLAVAEQHPDAVEALLDGGADVRLQDNLGRTPFHLAQDKSDQSIKDLLVRYGAKETPRPPVIEGPYFGQKLPGLTPEIFAPGIISTQKGFEFAGMFTPDGTEYYFTQRGLGFGQRIRFMKMENGVWSEPDFAPFTYDAFEFEPGISPDGDMLYYGSRRPLPGQTEANPSADIWKVYRRGTGWTEPEFVGTDMMYVTVSATGTIYTTGPTGEGSFRGIIKREWKDGELGEVVDLGENINFMQGTAHPYIAPDESYLIFDAQPHGNEAGPDMFISFRKEDTSWTKAVAFDFDVNTGREMCGYVSFDGRYFFFSRDGDIYWVDAKIIQLMRSKVM